MSDTPIRTLVVNSLVYAVSQISMIKGASRGEPAASEHETVSMPYSFCNDEPDFDKTRANRIVTCKFRFNIRTVFESENLDETFDLIEAEIHKAFIGSATLARAYNLDIAELTDGMRWDSPDNERFGAIDTPYQITYRHAAGNPYSLTPNS